MTPLTPDERDAVATLCLLAAFADGRKDDAERERLRAVFDGLGADFSADRYQRVLMGQADVAAEAARLASPVARTLAYEMAVAVCDADGQADAAEQAFLDRLRAALALDAGAAAQIDADGAALATAAALVPVAALAVAPVAFTAVVTPETEQPSGPDVEIGTVAPGDDQASLDAMVLRYAVLNGALELLPQTMATLAIVPMQTKMVYRIGLHYGHTLDQGHVKELLATVGLGLTSQVVETYARGLFGGLVGGALGKPLGKKKGKKAKKVAATAVGAALSFASTYALGRVAAAYYGGGRRLDAGTLRGLFERETAQGRALYTAHRPAIEQQARTTDFRALLAEVRGTGAGVGAGTSGGATGGGGIGGLLSRLPL